MIVSLEHVKKYFGATLILQDITARIEDNDRIGLIGVNGAGKTTLLNIINKELDTEDGTVSYENNKKIGFLRQSSGLTDSNTIQLEMESVFSHLFDIEDKMRVIEKEMEKTPHESSEYEQISKEYSAIQGEYELADGYGIQAKISTILNGMSFGDVDRNTPVSVLSGGERTRLALSKLLLESPDLLILDEPTNHLDFPTLNWLESYLSTYNGALLIVSHDRFFLDKLCTSIWEIQNHELSTYKGNYSKYLVLKRERITLQQKQYELQQVEIAEMEDFIARNIVRASTTARAQSRQKALDKMVRIEKPKLPPKPPFIRFVHKNDPVKDVLHVTGMSLSVGEGDSKKHLFTNVDLDLMRGEKVALVGANGMGKSSMLKALTGQLKPDDGKIEWGRNTEISYFDQGEGELNLNKTAIQSLWDDFPRENELSIRSVLGQAGLRGDDVFKQVGKLSGGERARLKFASFIMDCGNVLFMDEPTNHLDLATKEVLDDALQEYEGTLFVVSHDRYLLNKFPDKIAELHPDGLLVYNGKYDDYQGQKQKETEQKVISKPSDEKPEKGAREDKNLTYRSKEQRKADAQKRNQLGKLETRIEELESIIKILEEEITLPEVASDYQLLEEKCGRLDAEKQELDNILFEWTELSE